MERDSTEEQVGGARGVLGGGGLDTSQVNVCRTRPADQWGLHSFISLTIPYQYHEEPLVTEF